MDIPFELTSAIKSALKSLGIEATDVVLEHPADMSHGDYATNVALAFSKQLQVNPRELGEKLAAALRARNIPFVERIDVAGPGFINFHVSRATLSKGIEEILKRTYRYGTGNLWRNTKVLIEYTDPNPFKEFHIGHLMANAIGESLARLIGSHGAKVRRMCYQGDVGMHVAKAMWAIMRRGKLPSRLSPLKERIAFIGSCYVEGSKAYEEDAVAKVEIEAVNKAVFEGKDRKLMKAYKRGRRWSLSHFEDIYRELGTKFNYYVLESEVIHDGVAIVNEFLDKGVFEKSEGAVVFKGEKYDPSLHTRVFINSQGLPTYEAKELGLNTRKWKRMAPDRSIIVTANEQSDYFRVVLKALELVNPAARKATEHISHGMLRFASGKMSSRTGNVITGESLIRDVEAMVAEKLKDRDISESKKEKIASIIAVAAIKYSILKQVTSSDIIYDFEKSISFEGDSGPYLLYTAVRASSVLAKAKSEKIKPVVSVTVPATALEKLLVRYPETVERAAIEKAPHLLAGYLIETAAAFNSWYANTIIVKKDEPESPHRVAVAAATRVVIENGLDLLGMKVPDEM
ncbi:MAG: arginine--tRNA ligase [bacterium]|nr:arginine--tRNA ligase [bacterium]